MAALYEAELRATAAAMVERGKGLLACDEPPHVLPQRMKMCWTDLEACDATWRRDYRELMFSTPGLATFVSGVILHEETVGQTMGEASFRGPLPTPRFLASLGVLAGVKVDGGFGPAPGDATQWRTNGLDGLAARCAAFREAGCVFAKWRSPVAVDFSDVALDAEADALACYARVCQDEGLVPIIEPDVVIDGAATVERVARATKAALSRTFAACHRRGVDVRGAVLKTNMVRPGPDLDAAPDLAAIGAATVAVLADVLPAALPGVVFLSGGMSDAFATDALDAINRAPQRARCPWPLSFSFGRALQQPFRETWRGDAKNAVRAQSALLDCARRNADASLGAHDAASASASTAPLHVAGGNRY